MNIIKDVLDARSSVMKPFKNSIESKKKDVSSATARTLSKNKHFSVQFVEKQKITDNDKFVISIINVKDLKEARGQIDLKCFFERFIDKKIFTSEQPDNHKEKKIFDLTHHVRAIVLGIVKFPGSRNNIEYFYSKNNYQISEEYEEYSDIFFYLYKFFQNKVTKNFKTKIKEHLKLNQLINSLKKNITNHQKFSKISRDISKLFNDKIKESQKDAQTNGPNRDKHDQKNFDKNDRSLGNEKIKKLQFAQIKEIKNQKENNKSTPKKKLTMNCQK